MRSFLHKISWPHYALTFLLITVLYFEGDSYPLSRTHGPSFGGQIMMFATTFLMALHLGLKNTHWKRLFPLSVALFAYLVPASIAFLIHYQPWLVYYFMYYLVWGFLFYFLIHLFFGALGLGFGSFIRKKRAHKEANQ